jgi:hypothetical protein
MVQVFYNDVNSYTPSCVSINVLPSLSFAFEGFHDIEMTTLLHMKKCMNNGKTSNEVSGGGNSSFWMMYCDKNTLKISIRVRGSGLGCDMALDVECNENLMKEIDCLIEVARCIERKIQYDV